MDAYRLAAEQQAEALLGMMSYEHRQEVYLTLTSTEPNQGLWISCTVQKMALDLLSADPASLVHALDETTPTHLHRLFLWSHLRRLALKSANAIRCAQAISDLNGLGYREATRGAAQLALQFDWEPTPEEIAFGETAIAKS